MQACNVHNLLRSLNRRAKHLSTTNYSHSSKLLFMHVNLVEANAHNIRSFRALEMHAVAEGSAARIHRIDGAPNDSRIQVKRSFRMVPKSW
jgi:hypothetical protein